jgi:hypothetical protein
MPRKKPDPPFTKREVLLWLVGQDEEDIRAVLMAIGRDSEVEELELHGEPVDLVEQLEGSRPRLESLVAAIDDALGIDEETLGRRVHGVCETEPEIVAEDVEVEPDDELYLGEDEDQL